MTRELTADDCSVMCFGPADDAGEDDEDGGPRADPNEASTPDAYGPLLADLSEPGPGMAACHLDSVTSWGASVIGHTGQLRGARDSRVGGSRISNLAPCPGPSLWAVMVPPWASMIALLMVRPMPEPDRSRLRAVSPR